MNVFSASHSISLLTYTDGGNIGNSVLVSLQAGHEYVVYVKTTGDCSQYGTFASTMASDSGNYTTTWSYMEFYQNTLAINKRSIII